MKRIMETNTSLSIQANRTSNISKNEMIVSALERSTKRTAQCLCSSVGKTISFVTKVVAEIVQWFPLNPD